MNPSATKPASLQLGEFEITPVMDGYFRLDGGSMFGVVPRVVWEKKITPYERHRIILAVRCLLVRNGKRTVLIDSGQGNKQSEKFRDRYAVDQPLTLLDNLQHAGVRPEDVTDVINCHLHFDHAGWNTVRDKDRIEIYRPLIADPKEVRRKRAEEGKVMKKGGGDA